MEPKPARSGFWREHLPYGDATHPLLYGLAHFAVGQFIKYKYDIEIFGRKYLNTGKQMVIAPNHEWVLDPGVMGISVEKQSVPTWTKAEMWTDPKYRKLGIQAGRVLGLVDAFPVRRGENDREAMRTSRNHAIRGRSIGIFGTSTRTADLTKMLQLPASTAYSHEIPIQPMAIAKRPIVDKNGTRNIVRVVAGPPIRPDKNRPAAIEKRLLTEELIRVLTRDRARAAAWAEFDAKYRPQKQRFGRIKRY